MVLYSCEHTSLHRNKPKSQYQHNELTCQYLVHSKCFQLSLSVLVWQKLEEPVMKRPSSESRQISLKLEKGGLWWGVAFACTYVRPNSSLLKSNKIHCSLFIVHCKVFTMFNMGQRNHFNICTKISILEVLKTEFHCFGVCTYLRYLQCPAWVKKKNQPSLNICTEIGIWEVLSAEFQCFGICFCKATIPKKETPTWSRVIIVWLSLSQ